MGNASILSKAIFIFIISFLIVQIIFLYNVTSFLNNAKNDNEPKVSLSKDECVVDPYIPCPELSEKICTLREDCFPLYGAPCNNYYKKEFVYCYDSVSVRKAKKIKLDKPIPEWSSGHPDFKYFCAFNPNSTDQFYRFDQFIPLGWEQTMCSYNCPIDPPVVPAMANAKLTLVALVHREFDSFKNALLSWKRSGLLDYADETILFINQKLPGTDPIEELAMHHGLTILSSPVNLGIGPAISKLILAAKNPLVIFLEKDWEVVEPREVVYQQLDAAKQLLFSQVNGSRADAVKLRSRYNAGDPNIDPKLCTPPEYDNVELNAWAQFRWFEELNDHQWWLPHLFCNIFHFESDEQLFSKWPNRIWKCSEEALCFDSAQCGWTNNPIIFFKHWYLDTLYEISQREDNPTFEGGTYYAHEWIDPHWVIAEVQGFFKHHEINEHQ